MKNHDENVVLMVKNNFESVFFRTGQMALNERGLAYTTVSDQDKPILKKAQIWNEFMKNVYTKSAFLLTLHGDNLLVFGKNHAKQEKIKCTWIQALRRQRRVQLQKSPLCSVPDSNICNKRLRKCLNDDSRPAALDQKYMTYAWLW